MNKVSYNTLDFKSLLPVPDTDANKYSRGCCHIVAGSNSFPGAAILCSQAAARSGAGYVNLYTQDSHVPNIAVTYPTVPVKSFQSLDDLDFSKLHKPYSFVVGPGFCRDDSAMDELIVKIADFCDCPIVLDGGALSRFSCKSVVESILYRAKKDQTTIITPHMGEAKYLLNSLSCDNSDGNPETIAQQLAGHLNCICVLKGPDTFICDGQSQFVYKDAGPELSVAGTGDVLAGVLGSILATGKVKAFDAASLSVHIHSTSAKLSKDYLGPISTTAADVLENIPYAIGEIFDIQ